MIPLYFLSARKTSRDTAHPTTTLMMGAFEFFFKIKILFILDLRRYLLIQLVVSEDDLLDWVYRGFFLLR